MKTSALSIFAPIFALCSTVLLTACTPPDNPVVDPNTRSQIENQKSRSNSNNKGGTSSNSLRLFDYPLSSYLIERQIEAVELLKLAVGSADPVKTLLKVDRAGADEMGVEKVFISTSTNQMEYENFEQNWKYKTGQRYEGTYSLEDGLLAAATIEGKNAQKMSADSLTKSKNYINLIDNSYKLTATTSEDDASLLQVEVIIDGVLNGAIGAGNASHKVDVKIQMTVDKESLSADRIRLVSSNVNMTYPGTNGRRFNSDLSSQEYFINYSGLCSSAEGTISGKAGPKDYQIEVNQDVIKIKNWEKPWAACGKRPVIDLGRFLNN